jgi:hypothetical protein
MDWTTPSTIWRERVSIKSSKARLANHALAPYLVFDTTVLSLGVLSNEDGVDVVIRGLVAGDGNAWSDVSEQRECTTKGQVKGDVSLADWGGEDEISKWGAYSSGAAM